MRRLVLALSAIAAILIVAVAVVLAVVMLGGGGVDEEAYRQQIRPLLVAWQGQMALETFECQPDDAGGGEEFTAQDVEFFKGSVTAIKDIHGDIQAIEAPKRYQPGLEAMGKIVVETEAVEADFDEMTALMQQFESLDFEALFGQEPPSREDVAWLLRAGGAFQAWGTDVDVWSDFVDCTLSQDRERIGELGGYMRQLEIDLEEIYQLRQEGPQGLVQQWAPLFDLANAVTQALGRLSRALEHQAEVERVFADVIEVGATP